MATAETGRGLGRWPTSIAPQISLSIQFTSAVGISTASTNIVFQYNTIINPGLDGIFVGPPYVGSCGNIGNALIYSNTVMGLSAGYAALTNDDAGGYAAILPVAANQLRRRFGRQHRSMYRRGQDLTGIQAGRLVGL